MNGRSPLSASLPAAGLVFFVFTLPVRGIPIPRASVRLEPPEAVRGQTTVFTVSVSWEGEASDLAFSRPDPPFCRGLSVIGSAQRSVAYRDRDGLRQVREFLFTLRGEEEGAGRVEPVRLAYRRPPGEEEYTLSTEPLEVSVVSRRASSFLPFPAVLGLALAAAVLIAVYIRWMVRRYQKKSNELIADYVENLESETLKELEGARRHRLEGETEQYCRGMRAVLLNYLERRSALASPPGGEGAAESSAEPAGEEEAELARILRRLDEYWFGGTGDDMLQLDEIYRRGTGLLQSMENK